MNINKHDLSDEELDHLFGYAAEKMEFDFDPDSWNKMSQKLDAVKSPASSESQAGNVWRKRGLLLLLALLLMFGGYYFTKNTSPDKAATNLENIQKNTPKSENNANDKKYVSTDKVGTDKIENLNENTNKPESKPITEKDINTLPSANYENKNATNELNVKSEKETTSKEITSANRKIIKETASKTSTYKKANASASAVFEDRKLNKTIILGKSKSKNAEFENQNAIVQNEYSVKASKNKEIFQEKPKQVSEKHISQERGSNIISDIKEKGTPTENLERNFNEKPTQTLENSNVSSQNTTIQTSDGIISPSNSASIIADEKTERWSLGELKNLSSKKSIFKSNLILPIIAFESPKVEPAMPTSKNSIFNRGFYLRLGFSPDFSYATIDETTRLGSNYTALLEYRFNKRFSVQSGVIRSMKYYDAYPASYEWPSIWPNPPTLLNINAVCRMLDIPLNIRYDISQKQNSRWFVGAGLTSYIMKNEKYTYNYENPSDPKIKRRAWSGIFQKSPYYASVLNFSLGYEQKFFRKLTLQAEPFLKMPIGKIGIGNVKLSTIGVFITAKYPLARF